MKAFERVRCFLLLFLLASCGGYDDEALWNELNSLKDRVTAIEGELARMNENISSLNELVAAVSDNIYITDIYSLKDGYALHFSNGSVATVMNGKDGAPAPILNIGYEDGRYYWTQTVNGKTTWLLDCEGNKIQASGTDATPPLLKIDSDGYWLVSYDNGYHYSRILDEDGHPVKATGKEGKSFFQSVEIVGDDLVLVLNDGTEFVIPVGEPSPYKAVDLGLSVRWANCNLGAAAPAERGNLYLWGDPDHKGIFGLYTAPGLDNICGSEYDAARKSWKGSWRLPNKTEQRELVTRCRWQRKVVNGVSGMKVTGGNGNSIFLPSTGMGYPKSGHLGDDNTQITNPSDGFYWVGESYADSDQRFAYVFYFQDDTAYYNASWNTTFVKVAIRPVK